ncbi:hypothetical protein Tco_0386622 [Tanacetum coccineum]
MLYNKLQARLSKWKVKTLSIGGRLTLLKSVLGASPIYYMSIFKVPKGVLKTMESIRSKFFNGVDSSDRKISWVAWDNVLASKLNGGLGVSSFFALKSCSFLKWVTDQPSIGGSILREVKSLKDFGLIFLLIVTPFVCSELDKDIVVAIKMGASFGFKPSFSSDCVDELKRQHGYLSSINELVFVSFRLPKKGWTCILSGDEFKRWRMSTWLFFRVTWLGFSSLKFCVVGCGLAGGFVLSSDWDACSYPFELCFRRRQVYLEGVILCSDGGLEARNHCSLTQ